MLRLDELKCDIYMCVHIYMDTQAYTYMHTQPHPTFREQFSCPHVFSFCPNISRELGSTLLSPFLP